MAHHAGQPAADSLDLRAGKHRAVECFAQRSPDTLLLEAQDGITDASERLVAVHYKFIFRTAYRWLGNRSDAEDVCQSVCLRLPDAIRGFDRRSKFTSWLYRITLNAVRDLQRSQQRNARYLDSVARQGEEVARADQEDNLRVDDIWRAVKALPDKQRDAVLLVIGRELSQAEAAVIMECKEVTVSWHIHKARKTLKMVL